MQKRDEATARPPWKLVGTDGNVFAVVAQVNRNPAVLDSR